jgi:hypothetical protein
VRRQRHQDVHHLLAAEGQFAGTQRVQDAAEAEQVRARVHVLVATGLLGRHERWRADDDARPGDLGVVGLHARQAKVENDRPRRTARLRFQPDVRRLDVAMDQPRLMRGAQSLGNFLADAHDLIDGQPLRFLPVSIERLALQEGHGNEGNAVVLADFVDRANEIACDTGGGTGFAQEALAILRVAGNLRLHDLQGDAALEVDVLRLVDHAHAAVA